MNWLFLALLQAGHYDDVCSSWEGVPDDLHADLRGTIGSVALRHLEHLAGADEEQQQRHCDWLLYGDLFQGPEDLLSQLKLRLGTGFTPWPHAAVWLLLPMLLQQQLLLADATARGTAGSGPQDSAPNGDQTAGHAKPDEAGEAAGQQQVQQQVQQLLDLYLNQAMKQPYRLIPTMGSSSSSSSIRPPQAASSEEVVQTYLAVDNLIARCSTLSQESCPLVGTLATSLTHRMRRVPSAALYTASGALGAVSSPRLLENYLDIALGCIAQDSVGVGAAARVLRQVLQGLGGHTVGGGADEVQVRLGRAVLGKLSDEHSPVDCYELLQQSVAWCDLFRTLAVAPPPVLQPLLEMPVVELVAGLVSAYDQQLAAGQVPLQLLLHGGDGVFEQQVCEPVVTNWHTV